MGMLKSQSVTSKELSRRPLFLRPPEPPPDFLMLDPSNSIYVGRTKMFHVPFNWSFMQLTNPHICIVGITGAGKSYFVKTFLSRAAFVWGSNAIIIDWAGEYKAWVKQTGGKIISLGKGDFVNLMDLGGMRPIDRVKQITRALEILTDLGGYPEQRRLTEQAIEEAYVRAGFKPEDAPPESKSGGPVVPTLKEVVAILEERLRAGTYEFPAELENAIYRIKQFTRKGNDFFARPSSIKLEELTHAGLVDIDLSGLPDEVLRGLAGLFFLQFLKERMRSVGWSATKGVKVFVVLDEAWKIASDDRSDAIMVVREGRKYQFGLIVASQNPTDINEAIFSNVGTTFILRVKFEKYLDYIQGSLGFSPFMRNEISKFGVGQCAVNMAFQTTTEFPETFLLERVHGEEPLEEYFMSIESLLPEQAREDPGVLKTFAFERGELRNRLVEFGIEDTSVNAMMGEFEKGDKTMDVVAFVNHLEDNNVPRASTSSFLKSIGIDDATIIDLFSRVDFMRGGGSA